MASVKIEEPRFEFWHRQQTILFSHPPPNGSGSPKGFYWMETGGPLRWSKATGEWPDRIWSSFSLISEE